MTTNDNNQNPTEGKPEGEGSQPTSEEIKLTKAEYDELQKIKVEHGSFKRELKDLKKSQETKKDETPEQTKPEDSALLKKAFLRSSGITEKEEQELALETAKKWGVEVDALVEDADWQTKLSKFRTEKSNALAASGLKGGAGTSGAKNTTEYWKAKGTPPTPDDVPDRKTRQKIVRELRESSSNKGTRFYNEQ